MNYNTLPEAMEQVGWSQEIDALSVYRAFEQVEDGRHKRGVRSSVIPCSRFVSCLGRC